MNFINVVIGGIEDQVGALIFGWWGESFINLLNAPFGFHFVNSWKTNQPIFSFVFTEGIKVINPVIFSNIFAFFGIFLTVVLSFILFRALKFAWFLSLVLALIFAFSPYVFMHIGIHPALSQIWLIPLFFQRVIFQRRHLLQGVSFANSIVTGFILAVAVLISNYLGFFLLLFAFCFFISDLICKRIFNCPFQFVAFLRYYLIILVSFVLLVIPFLLPYIKANYFSHSASVANAISLSPQRTLEDFQNFSARPWYYVLPPLAHPILGNAVTRPVLDWMKNDWGYFLADDYFPKEHGGDFLGWFNLTLFLIAITFAIKDIVKNVKCQMSNVKSYKISSLCEVKAQNHKSFYSEDFLKLVLTLALTIVLLFLFTMPPFFTVGGHKIYTLGFVLYKFFPMFRVTARLGVVILMGVLVINGVFLQSLFLKSQNSNVKCQKLQNKFASRSHISNVKTFILFLYLIGSLFEFYVPVSTFDASKVPTVYEYLSKVDKKTSFDFTGPNGKKGYYEGPLIIAEYPSGRAEDIFWITAHQKGLINPRMYKNEEYGFDSEKFTKLLLTKEGIESARNLHVQYLIFHRDRNPNSQDETFFSDNLKMEKDFGDVILFRF